MKQLLLRGFDRALLMHIPGVWPDLEDLHMDVSLRNDNRAIGPQDPAKVGMLVDTAFARIQAHHA